MKLAYGILVFSILMNSGMAQEREISKEDAAKINEIKATTQKAIDLSNEEKKGKEPLELVLIGTSPHGKEAVKSFKEILTGPASHVVKMEAIQALTKLKDNDLLSSGDRFSLRQDLGSLVSAIENSDFGGRGKPSVLVEALAKVLEISDLDLGDIRIRSRVSGGLKPIDLGPKRGSVAPPFETRPHNQAPPGLQKYPMK